MEKLTRPKPIRRTGWDLNTDQISETTERKIAARERRDETTMDSINHPLNQGRESLWQLDKEQTYIVQGINSGMFSTNMDHTARIAMKDVLVFENDSLKGFTEETPVVAFAQHINCIRKTDGLEYTNLQDNEKTTWLGKVELYDTKGVDRITLKLFRSTDINKELRTVEKRIRNLESLRETLKPEEIVIRNNKTCKLLERCKTVVDSHQYIFYINQEEIDTRISNIQEYLNSKELLDTKK